MGNEKDTFVLSMNPNPRIKQKIIREADTFTSSLFTITYYLLLPPKSTVENSEQ